VSGIRDSSPGGQPLHDAWLTALETFSGPAAPRWVDPTNTVELALDRSRIDVDSARRLGPDVQQAMADAADLVNDTYLVVVGPDDVFAEVRSGLPEIAGTIESAHDQARVTVPLLMLQLGLLAVVVLWLVLGAAIEQRRPEIALARLRGRGLRGGRRLVLRELVPVVLAGVVVGAELGLGIASWARHTVLDSLAPFETPPTVWVVLAAVPVLMLLRRAPVAGPSVSERR
jgi:putative ABC transport system permease protein